jgi:predicted O-linked N-acetylglucosamine transferase (SPINDLY family)
MSTTSLQQTFEAGLRHQEAGRLAEAAEIYQRILASQPDHLPATLVLARLAHQAGQSEPAINLMRRAIELQPNDSSVHSTLAMMLATQNRLDEAATILRRAISIRPDQFETWNNLGNVLQQQGHFEEAAATYQVALRLRPDDPIALANLAAALRDLGQLDEVISNYRQSLAIRPNPAIGSNLLLVLHFHPASTPRSLWEEHEQWRRMYATHIQPMPAAYANHRDPNRRIRVGYLCAEFNGGPTGRFLLPLLENHSRENVEVFCYANNFVSDAMTARFQGLAACWRSITTLADEQVASLVRNDRIDILIDCVKHMRGNRLLTFARRSAPVQVTYLPYSSTTGIDAIDYRITDQYLDTADDDRFFCEWSVRLSGCYWCYVPPAEAPALGPPPFESRGQVTFGCLNSYFKVTEPVLVTWFNLLREVEGSRLVLCSRPGVHRRRAQELAVARGIEPRRVEFFDHRPLEEYFRQYNSIDIGLDPFPYGGGTTTCDALWMGVPVVSLRGRTSVSRAGLSILSNLGLSELVAENVEQYVRIASELAAAPTRLAELRAGMRRRMQGSRLMDARGFAADFEAALRRMWVEWCAGRTVGVHA